MSDFDQFSSSERSTTDGGLDDNSGDGVSEGEEAVEGNGSLAAGGSSIFYNDRRFAIPNTYQIGSRKDKGNDVFYTSDIEHIARMDKVHKEFLDKVGEILIFVPICNYS